MRLVFENGQGRIACSERGFICQQRSGRSDERAGLSLGRPRVECQAAALRRGRAFQSQRTELATCISEKLLIAFVSAKVADSL